MADNLKFTFGADTGPLDKALATVGAKFDQLGRSVPQRAFERFHAEVATLGTLLSAGTFIAAIKSTIDGLDDLNKAAQSAGISVESLSSLRFAASFAGLRGDELQKAIEVLSSKLAAASAGSKEAAASFSVLGIKFKDAKGNVLAADEALKQIADKFASYADGANKTALAAEYFGQKIGPRLIPFLNQGAAGIEELKRKAQELGLVIGSKTAADAERFNDQIQLLGEYSKSTAIKMTENLLPALNKYIEKLLDARNATGSFLDAFTSVTSRAANSTRSVGEIAGELSNAQNELARLQAEGISETSLSPSAFRVQKLKDDVARLKGELALARVDYERLIAESNRLERAFNTGGNAAGKQAPGVPNLSAIDAEKRRLAEADKAREDFRQRDLDYAIKRQEADTKRLNEADKQRQEFADRQLEDAIKARNAEQKLFDDSTLAYSNMVSDKLAYVQQFVMSDREIEDQRYQEQIDAAYSALEKQYINEQQYLQLVEELHIRHQASIGDIWAQGVLNRRKFEEMSVDAQAANILGTLEGLTAGAAKQNRTMFEIHKAAAIASAVVSTYQGAARAFADYPYPYDFIVAAAVIAGGLAQVAQIQSASFDNAGVGGGGGYSGTAANNQFAGNELPVVPQAQKAPRNIDIRIVGNNFSSEQVRDLIEKINEQSDFGATINVSRA